MVFATASQKTMGNGKVVSLGSNDCPQCTQSNYKRQQTFRAKVVAHIPNSDCDRVMSYLITGADDIPSGGIIPIGTGGFSGSGRMGSAGADYLQIVIAGNYRYDVSYTLAAPGLTSAYIEVFSGSTRIARFYGVASNSMVTISGTGVSLLQASSQLTVRINLLGAATADVLGPNSEYQGVLTVQKL